MTDKLPPEVAEALNRVDAGLHVQEHHDALDALRAHIQRLTDESARLRESHKMLHRRCQDAEAALPDYRKIIATPPDGDGVRFVRGSLGRALLTALCTELTEERDALKARIAEAGKAMCCNDGGLVGPSLIAYMADEDIGKVFALVKMEDAAHD